MSLAELLSEISALCIGLIYVSETDAPVSVFFEQRKVETLTPQTFKEAAKKPPFAEVEVRSFDDIFRPLIANDKAGRWDQLQQLLEANLEATTAFKIKENPSNRTEYTIFLIGLFEGQIVGVVSFGIAT